MFQMYVTLAVFLLMIISFCLNKIPMAITSMLGMLVLVATGCVEPSQALSNIGSSVAVTMASMFIIAAGLNRTQLVPKLSGIVYKVSKGSFTKVLAGYVIVTFILGQFIPSITALFALVCPLVIGMCDEMGFKPSKMMYSIGLVTVSCSYAITPIGPYVGNYIENNGLLAEYGIEGFTNTIFTETSIKLPVTILIMLYAIFIAPKFAPENPVVPIRLFDAKKAAEKVKLPIWQEVIAYVAFFGTVVCLIFKSFGLPSWLIPAIAACLVVASGILRGKDAIGSMGIDIILLYVGVVTLGNAFAATGAGDMVGGAVAGLLQNTRNSYVIGAVFFVASFVMTSLLYNRAVSKVLIPLALVTYASLKCDPRGIMQMCYIGSMSSLITPMATSVVPMMMGAGGYDQKTLLKMGWLPSILMAIATVAIGMTLYPCF
ncbi:MAG: anion permease [Lachnospiraceae bacterium]|nr:anion permease [Lachnospiraceae bacterium]